MVGGGTGWVSKVDPPGGNVGGDEGSGGGGGGGGGGDSSERGGHPAELDFPRRREEPVPGWERAARIRRCSRRPDWRGGRRLPTGPSRGRRRSGRRKCSRLWSSG